MKKLLYLLSLISFSSLILVREAKANPSVSKPSVEVTQAIDIEKPEYTGIVKKIDDIAKEITVKIENSSYGGFGSGVIIAHQGNTYYVLTAKHVLCSGESKTECISTKDQILTPDGKAYTIDPQNITIPAEWLDLAVVEFQSEENYQVATIGNYNTGNQWIFTSGFRDTQRSQAPTRVFTVGALYPPNEADFLVKDSYTLQDGQDLIYTNITYSGMSGSAILDSGGRLIGINTASEAKLDFITEDGQAIILNDGYSIGISVKHFLESVDKTNVESEWLNVAVIPPPAIDQIDLSQIKKHFYTVEKQEYTGIVKDIDNIAQNISVKIENSNIKSEFGSGVIVAKEDNTYYVLTAHHVINDLGKYQVVTKDGKKYLVNRQNIQLFPAANNPEEFLDIALIKFESKSDYQIATLGTYDITSSWVFAAGFAKDNNGYNLALQQSITVGKAQQDTPYTYNAPSIYEEEDLSYSNVTYPGMSGGAILDSKGNLLGIHTAEDNVCNIFSNKIEPGFSRGVSIISILESLKLSQSKVPFLEIDPIKPSISAKDIATIFEQLIGKAPQKNARYSDWINYGNYLWRLGLNQEAITAFEQALLKDEPRQAYYGLGLVYLELKDYQKAVINFEQASNLQPDRVEKVTYLRNWGRSLFLAKDYEQALQVYDLGLKEISSGEGFTLLIERGDTLAKLERYEEAINSYSAALKIKSHPVVYFKRSLVYHRLRKYQHSLNNYNKAIESDIKSAQLYVNCSEHKTSIEKYELALNRFETTPLFLQNPENVKLYKLAKSNINKLKAVARYSPAVPR